MINGHDAIEFTDEDVFEFLDELRESGETNMFGARPYVVDEFNIPVAQAGKLVSEWMRTFEERHKGSGD